MAALLLEDRQRQGGRISVDDLLRTCAGRGLSVTALLAIRRRLAGLGARLDPAVDPPDLLRTSQGPVQQAESLDDPIRDLLRRAGVDRILARDEVAVLIRRIRAAEALRLVEHLEPEDAADALELQRAGKRARDLLVNSNLRLILFVIRQYAHGTRLDRQDLVQEGTIGLMRAIDLFDLSYAGEFSTYATCWIRQRVTRYVQNTGRMVRLPVHRQAEVARLRKRKRQLARELGRDPTVPELALAMGMATEEVAFLIDVQREVLSLDTPNSHDHGTLAPLVANEVEPEPDERGDRNELLRSLQQALTQLTAREQSIVQRRFGLDGSAPETLEGLAQRYDLSRERIRQIERKALDRLAHPMRARLLRDFL